MMVGTPKEFNVNDGDNRRTVKRTNRAQPGTG